MIEIRRSHFLQCSVLLPVVLTLISTQVNANNLVKDIANFCYPKWALEAFVIANADRYATVSFSRATSHTKHSRLAVKSYADVVGYTTQELRTKWLHTCILNLLFCKQVSLCPFIWLMQEKLCLLITLRFADTMVCGC